MLRPMAVESDRAELSSLRAQVDELARRVTQIAERYDDTSDSLVASDLFAAERALLGARRSLERAEANLAETPG
jgi:hypothetical protein